MRDLFILIVIIFASVFNNRFFFHTYLISLVLISFDTIRIVSYNDDDDVISGEFHLCVKLKICKK